MHLLPGQQNIIKLCGWCQLQINEEKFKKTKKEK